MTTELWSLAGIVIGLALGIIGSIAYSKAGLNKNQQQAAQILSQANSEAEARLKQAVLDGKTQVHDLKVEAEKEIKERRQEAVDLENSLLRREDSLNFRDQSLNQKEKELNGQMK